MKDLTISEVLRRAREFNADAEYIREWVAQALIKEGDQTALAHWYNLRLECQRAEARHLDEIARRFAEAAS